MTLRIAVLGVGRIGKMHAELVARQVPGASLAMVQDINADAAAAIAAELDVPHTTDVDEVLASGDVDAVAICSSTDTHVPLMVAAARAGKAIFCEKPVSLDLAKVDEGLAAVEAGAVPCVGHLAPTRPGQRPRPAGRAAGDGRYRPATAAASRRHSLARRRHRLRCRRRYGGCPSDRS